MAHTQSPSVTNVDVTDLGVIITFDDGRTALYSIDLLLSVRTQATEMLEDESEA